MNAYVDNNFLIDCIGRDGWRSITANACSNSDVKLILSPWSIYEIGNASHIEELLDIVEAFRPLWILERVDLQLREFIVAWNSWKGIRFAIMQLSGRTQMQTVNLKLNSGSKNPLMHQTAFLLRTVD